MHELNCFGEFIEKKWIIDVEIKYPWYQFYKWSIKKYNKIIIWYTSEYHHYVCDSFEEVKQLLDEISKNKNWEVISQRYIEYGEVF